MVALNNSVEDVDLYRITDNPMHYFAAIQRQNQANLSRALAHLGLTPPMWRVLAMLSDSVGRTIGEIAEAVVIDRANLGRLLEAMADDQLVERIASERDRRQSLTQLTKIGRQRFRAALPIVRKLYEALLADVDADEFATLMATLRKLKRNGIDGERD